MKTVLSLESQAAFVAFAEEAIGAGVKTRDSTEAESLKAHAKVGDAFFVETDDPWLRSFHVYVDEPVPEDVEQVCGSRSGSFLLHAPAGRLSVCGIGTESPETEVPPEVHTFEVPPGDYAVSLLDGSDHEVPALLAHEKALVDDADWRLYQRVHNLGAAGCLGVAAGMIFVLVPYTRRELWFLLPLFLIPSLVYSLLKRLAGYVRVEERIREYESSLPQFVISLRRVESTEGLAGGGYRC